MSDFPEFDELVSDFFSRQLPMTVAAMKTTDDVTVWANNFPAYGQYFKRKDGVLLTVRYNKVQIVRGTGPATTMSASTPYDPQQYFDLDYDWQREVTQPTAQRPVCECGSEKSSGIKPYEHGHSDWCPVAALKP